MIPLTPTLVSDRRKSSHFEADCLSQVGHSHSHHQNIQIQTSNKSCSSSSRNSVATLMAIVMMYLICNVPRLTLNTAEYLMRDEFGIDECGCPEAPEWIYVLIQVSNMCLVINTSANFVIYFAVCKKFKTVLRSRVKDIKENLFCCCRK